MNIARNTPFYVIKLGGSVITNKKENKLEFYQKTIERIADEIKAAQKEKEFSLIIVHGVGAYGHKLVREYGIKNGITTALQYEGFHKTHQSILQLHEQIMRILEKKLTLERFIPLDIFTTDNKRIINADINKIKDSVNKKRIPILFGDMVVDQQLTAIPLSGDDIACYLAKELNADCLFFGSDVDGIYDNDKNIIAEINQQNSTQYITTIEESKHCDVTGGMKNKLEKVMQYKNKYVAYVFNLKKENSLYQHLTGRHTGTKIRIEKTTDYGAVNGIITFDEKGNTIMPIELRTIKNNSFTKFSLQ